VVWQCSADDLLSNASFGELSFVRAAGKGIRLDSSRPLTVSFAREGVRCRPLGREHSQSLKKLFQESSVPPWLRERTPLIYQNDQLLAVVIGGSVRMQRLQRMKRVTCRSGNCLAEVVS